ncbi:MAG TPA: hypothetical protein VKE94_24270 [Gemmataceae bacterium]|nr:hypothetical protein [Gemmataceae bacterium]
MSPKQIIVIAVGVAILAGGITYLVASIGPSGDAETKSNEPQVKVPLPVEFPSQFAGPRFEEAFTAGNHPFLFRNKKEEPIPLGVYWKNCKCSSVEICAAPPNWQGLSDAELIKKADDPNLEWTKLDKDDKGFVVPPKAAGWIRLGWGADKNSDTSFKADFWVYSPDHGLGFELEMPVSFVEAVRIGAADDPQRTDQSLGRLGPGDQRDVKFVIWSPTRESFTLEAAPPRNDPCLAYGEPKKLPEEELKRLSQTGRKALSGYEVTVTARERAGDHQFDIGPFRREVRWKTNAAKDPIRANVVGTILGEVTAFVAGNPDEPRLDMGVIDADRPRVHRIRLESENPAVELALDDATSDFLDVKMLEPKEGKKEDLGDATTRKTWNVQVSFRTDSGFRGRFPDVERPGYESTAVVFRITHAGAANETPRRIKVTARGQVRN